MVQQSRGTLSVSRSPPVTCRASLIFKPAGGAPPFRIRSTVARRRQWRTSRRWLMCSPAAPPARATRVTPDACNKLSAASMPPRGAAPTDTLTAAQSIARYPWRQPERLFALLDEFYPILERTRMRPVPFMPYLNFSPSAWILPLKFDGGGYRAGGKAMFDSEGNLWGGGNFTGGWRGQNGVWRG